MVKPEGQAAAKAMDKDESWYPYPRFAISSTALDGAWTGAEAWPELIVEKWERNDSGERRIVSARRYVPAEE